ncbi:MAG: PASTA domain-containing protein [Bacteroidota bacterium]
MIKIGSKSIKDLLIHLSLMVSIGFILLLVFFKGCLPNYTCTDCTVTVPPLVGRSMQELEDIVIKRNLRYEVNDSSYDESYPPLTIIKQFPKPGAKVKENRKILISVNRVNPPSVPMPKLLEATYQNAQLILKSNGLKLGNVSKRPDPDTKVLDQLYNGVTIEDGERVPKGAKIDLVIGNGDPKGPFELRDDLVGLPYRQARFYIIGQDLKLGTIDFYGDSSSNDLVVLQHLPSAGTMVSPGDKINIIVGPSEHLEQELDSAILVPKVSFDGPFRILSVLGQSLEDAEASLLQMGLETGTVSYRGDTTGVDLIVVEQIPAVGESVEPGELIDLVLGPKN